MTKREFLDIVFALAPTEANAIMDAFDEYVDSNEPHWIPVTENCDCDLMDNEEVLVFQKDGTINGQIRHAMFYDFNGKKKFVTWEEGITIYNVLAYMPLPEPYKPTVPPECEGDCGWCKPSVIEKCKGVAT